MNTIKCYPWNPDNDYLSLSFTENITADCFCRNLTDIFMLYTQTAVSIFSSADRPDCFFLNCQNSWFHLVKTHKTDVGTLHFKILQHKMFTLYRHQKLKYSRITVQIPSFIFIFNVKTFYFKCISQQPRTPLPLTLHFGKNPQHLPAKC